MIKGVGVCDVVVTWGTRKGGRVKGCGIWNARPPGSPEEMERKGGKAEGPLPFSWGLCSLVCTAGTGPFLTAWALEARSTEAGGGARPVHTGTPIEARGWREEAVRGWVPCL